jgi:putative tricarboxylic transport membrane protein
MKSSYPNNIQNPEKVGALFFLAISISYGLVAFKIPLTLLAQQETFNARTMPFALSVLGALLSVLIIVLPASKESKQEPVKLVFGGLDWRRTGLIVVMMVVYAFAMTWLGFIIASILFLAGGFYILSERRIMILLAASIPLVIGIWLLMSKILGMYIAPGEIFYLMGVIE